jgi:hypothetical protein
MVVAKQFADGATHTPGQHILLEFIRSILQFMGVWAGVLFML